MKIKTIISLAALAILSSTGLAATINFGSQVPSTGKYSNGTDWLVDGSFHFEVGVFSAGFTPTLVNVSEWLSNWTLANMVGPGTTTWIDDGGDTTFNGGGGYTTNVGPWAIGSHIYLWGFDTRANGANQWILLQNSSNWLAVDSSTISPQAFQTFDSGTSTVIGSVNGTGDSFQSASVNVVPEPSTWMIFLFGSALLLLFRLRSIRVI